MKEQDELTNNPQPEETVEEKQRREVRERIKNSFFDKTAPGKGVAIV